MKKIIAFSAAVLISGMLTSSTLAHQDSSFTSITTFGIFETMYDYFKYSPAYLPSFEKAALWTQLSNLEGTFDQFFDWTGSNYYSIGLQTDILGAGRGGGMLDWYSEVTAANATNFAGDTGDGEVESTRTDYRDLDNDEIIDWSEERYGRIRKEFSALENDIYLVFGLGDIGGFALGASLRGRWVSLQPTVKDDSSESMDEEWSRKQFIIDPLGNKTQISELKGSRAGTLNYGFSDWRLKFGARSDELLPGVDLVANIGPILTVFTNEYDYTYRQTEVPDLLNPSTTILNEATEKGVEAGVEMYPGSGVGFLIDLRGDMELSQDLTLISEVGFSLAPMNFDGTEERKTRDVATPPIGIGPATTNDDFEKDAFTGDMTTLEANAKVRLIYQGPGWRLGFGLRGYIDSFVRNQTHTFEQSDTYRYVLVNGQSNPAQDYTETVVQSFTEEIKNNWVYNALEIPIALELPIVENGFVIYIGGQHTVTLDSYNTTVEQTRRQNRVVTRTYDDGTISTQIGDINNELGAEEETAITSNHDTDYMAGFSWFPAENMRVDVKNVFRHEFWRDFEISFNFFF